MEESTKIIKEIINRLSAGKNIENNKIDEEHKKELANLAKKKDILNKSDRKKKQNRALHHHKEKEKSSSLGKQFEKSKKLKEKHVENKSKRGLKETSKRNSKRKVKHNHNSKAGIVNNEILKKTYVKTKDKIEKMKQSRSLERLSTESIVCPDEISSHIDAIPDYECQEVTASTDVFVSNDDNNGNLFVNGVPFWMLKTEKLPEYVFEPIIVKLKQVVDGELVLLNDEVEPKDLDPFHDLPYMMSRDYEHFQKPNRLLSNLIRSLVFCSEFKDSYQKKSDDDQIADVPAFTQDPKVSFVIPTEITHYNRKNYLEPMRVYKFVPGALSRQIKRNKVTTLGY